MAGYNIAHFLPENERAIQRKVEERTLWLTNDHGERMWTPKKERAKRFFHQEEAESALVLIKMKWNIKEREPYRPELEKQSWDELSSD